MRGDVKVSRGSAAQRTPPVGTKRHVPPWVLISSLLLTLAGLGASSYLTVAPYNTTVVLACPSTGTINCEKVTTSPESMVFGIPVAVLGLAFFVGMLVLNVPWTWRLRWPLVHQARLLAVVAGVCFVVWLIYAELFRIDAICLWCTSVHVITVALFAVVLLGTAGTREVAA